MSTVMEGIWTFTASIFDVIVILYYFNAFYEKKAGKKKFLLSFCLAVLSIWTSFYVQNLLFNLTISLTAVLIIGVAFECNIRKKLLSAFALAVIQIFTEGVTAEICFFTGTIVYLGGSNYFLPEEKRGLYYLMAIFSKIFAVVVLYIFNRCIWKKQRGGMLQEMKPQHIVLLSISILCGTLGTIFNFTIQNSKIVFEWFPIIKVILIAINAVVWVLYYQMRRIDQLTMDKKLQQEEYRYKLEYYQELEQHQQEIRTIRHDMRNQLIGIVAAIPNQEKAERQIQLIMEEIASAEQKLFSENPAVNAVLNVKQKMAMEKGIKMEMDIKVPARLEMNPGDIGILLGNILDNAIEAAEKCEENRRYIFLKMYQYNKCLVISCENSTRQKVTSLQSQKADGFYHGIGLKSIEKIVEKYNGEHTIKTENSHFLTEISIWLH